jgi:hypothetical protein
MRLIWKDAIAAVLVAAIVAPFIGYMVTGSVPFIQDPTGMAGVGLILGLVGAAIGGWISLDSPGFWRMVTGGVGLASLALGILALVSESFLELGVRQGLLIAFIATLVVLWGLATVRHLEATGTRGARVAPV